MNFYLKMCRREGILFTSKEGLNDSHANIK